MDDTRGRPPDPRMIPAWYPTAAPASPPDSWRPGPRHVESSGEPSASTSAGRSHDLDDDAADQMVVRPFLLTGGRTRPAQEDLRVESLIRSNRGVRPDQLRFEARQIYDLCQRSNSVAEVAAALRMPLGVAKVLVSDLIADEYVTLVKDQTLSVSLIERIRNGVRAL